MMEEKIEATDILIKDGCVALSGDGFAVSEADAEWVELRASWKRLGDEKWYLAAKAMELHNFRSSNRYCSRCGSPMERATDISLKCSGCGREIWPHLSPAILVLVTRSGGEEALLVHAANFKRPEMYALVAGFVETGESLEQCVAREVKEETTLDIEDIRYFGSQSWPFPSQMMIGFTARYSRGELRLADGELTDARWWKRSDVPALPTLPSLSREMIDAWIDGKIR